MKRLFTGVVAAVLWLFAQAALALQVPGPLVDVAWLSQNVDMVKILEIRPEQQSFLVAPRYSTDKKTGKRYLEALGGHLPGSVWVDFSKVRADRTLEGQKVRYMVPEKADVERLVRSWGVDKGDAIVIVSLGEDVSDLNEAARVYWTLKYYGEDNLAILNGGTLAWLAAEKPVSTSATPPRTGNWTAGAERAELFATSEETAQASERKTRQLVDGRPIAQHFGLAKSGSVTQYGYIAGSRSVPTELLSKASGPAAYYHDADTYRALFKRLGVAEGEPTVAYCNTGHQATGVWFVMSELLGNRQVKLYDGSLHQWTLEKRPVVGLRD